MTLFDLLEQFNFDKKEINLFEAFAGIGSQAKALKRLSKELDFKLNTIGISEFDNWAVKSYEAIHGAVKNYGDITKIEKLPSGIDIFTYSFPCQDLSIAGKGAGIQEGTRSGLLYEVERLIEVSDKPKVLLMENVKNLVGVNHKPAFDEWCKKLESMGYYNYWQVLNAKNYGVPQNRERVFMVSILNDDRQYKFPVPFELKLKLKDMLEETVDEKYYLTGLQIKQIESWKSYQKPLESAKNIDDKYMQTITAKGNTSMNASMLLINEKTVVNSKQYKSYISWEDKKGRINTQDHRAFNKGISGTVSAMSRGIPKVVNSNYNRIRKLTPLECWRLMGFDDEDFYKAKNSGVSDSQLYKQAGNSIVVDVLYYIFKNLFDKMQSNRACNYSRGGLNMKIKGVKPLKTIPKIETSDDVIDMSSLSPSDVDKAIFEFAKLVRNDLK